MERRRWGLSPLHDCMKETPFEGKWIWVSIVTWQAPIGRSIMLTFIRFSKMEVLKDDLCFNLDLQVFFLKETFHVTKLTYNNGNEGHGRHAFFTPKQIQRHVISEHVHNTGQYSFWDEVIMK